MTLFSKPQTKALSEVLHALQATDAALVPDAVPHLVALSRAGHSLHIDIAATRDIGAPVVVAQATPQSELAALTPRQREVAKAVARGLTNKEIARSLGISPATVKDHVHAILCRLSLRRRSELAARLHGTAT